MAQTERNYYKDLKEVVGKTMEYGGIVAGIIGLLTRGEFLLVAGISSFFGGRYLQSNPQKA
ncbi:MAG: hypothetical protein HYT10_00580 [Candidatus Levybacteria bacterium]|nr:hypothetical protein [Candidatus Levybacteria bacterium]